MAEFALLVGGEFREVRNLPERPSHILHKKVEWYPVSRAFGEPLEGVEGDAYVIRTVDPATLPPPVPEIVSDRQFFQAAALAGLITQDDALAAVKTGDMPAAVAAAIDAMPEDKRFAAKMLLCGATTFQRGHPMTSALGEIMGKSSAEVDDLFRLAGSL